MVFRTIPFLKRFYRLSKKTPSLFPPAEKLYRSDLKIYTEIRLDSRFRGNDGREINETTGK